MLCQTCRTIFVSANRDGETSIVQRHGNHHETFDGLLFAVERDGCTLCSSLFASDLFEARVAPDALGGDSKQPSKPLLTYRWDGYTQGSLSPMKYPILRFESTSAKATSSYHEFAMVPPHNLPRSSNHWKSDPLADDATAEVEPLTISSKWLQSCLKDHKNCRDLSSRSSNQPTSPNSKATVSEFRAGPPSSGSDQRWFPKRLIDVGASHESIKIIESFQTPPTGPYATLSHCWGGQSDFTTLTAENIGDMKQRIPWELLPLTFRDAVHVTRKLGIRYVWIDSLCILQHGEGSKEDWKEHTTAMRDIYARCAVNISADRATRPSDGFLGPYRLNLISPVVVTISGGKLHRLVDLGLAQTCVGRSPLAQRAWVFQERWLSPRILHFTAYQVFWECHTLSLGCESFPDGCPTIADCDPWGGDQNDRRWSSSMAPFSHGRHTLEDRHSWYQILEEYTSRKLSFPTKDKFYALSGVVQQLQQDVSEEYVAGLFRSDLPIALTWARDVDKTNDEDRAPRRSDDTYCGPTWSWTAHDQPVTFAIGKECLDSDNVFASAEVVSTNITLVDTDDALGPIHHADIEIRGPVCNVRWESDYHGAKSQNLQLLNKDGDPIPGLAECEAILDHQPIHESLEERSTEMVILRIVKFKLIGDFAEAGILLIPVSESDRSSLKWKRIGVWVANNGKNTATAMDDKELATLIIV